MHSTNKAFERYFQIELDDIRSIYVDTKKPAPKMHRILERERQDNTLKLLD